MGSPFKCSTTKQVQPQASDTASRHAEAESSKGSKENTATCMDFHCINETKEWLETLSNIYILLMGMFLSHL